MKKITLFSMFLIVSLLIMSVSVVMAEDIDFGGRTVTIIKWGAPFQDFEEEGRAPGLDKEAEEKFNVNIELAAIPHGSYMDGLMTRLMSGDSANDIWYVQGQHFLPLAAQGALLPVEDVLSDEYFENLPAFARNTVNALTYDGKRYGFGVWRLMMHGLGFTVYNKTLFERENLADPYELYKKGDWTWSKVSEIAKKATRDTTGDGNIDQWGMMEMWPWNWVTFMYTNNAFVTKEVEGGKRLYTYDQQEAVDGLHQIYQWKQEDKVVGGNLGQFTEGKIAMSFLSLWQISADMAMEDDYGVVPLPKGPSADRYYYPAGATMSWFLPANSEDPEKMVALTDFLWSQEEYDNRATKYLQERVRDRDSFDVIMEGNKNFTGRSWRTIRLINGYLMPAIKAVFNGEKDPAAAMEEIKPEAQATLDELFVE